MAKQRTTLSASRAFSLVEFLFSLSLFAVLLLFSGGPLSLLLSVWKGEHRLERDNYLISSLRAELRSAVAQGNALYGLELLRPHVAGKILDSSGNLISSRNFNLSPQSNALSVLSLYPESLFFVLRQGSNNSFLLCLAGAKLSSSLIERNRKHRLDLLALAVDGYSEYRGSLLQLSIHSPLCEGQTLFRAQLKQASSSMHSALHPRLLEVLSKSSTRGFRYPLLFIPIEDSYTLFLDRQGTLRRFSHLSREEQPLLAGFRSVNLKLKNEANLSRLEARVQLRSAASKSNDEHTFAVLWNTPKHHSALDLLF